MCSARPTRAARWWRASGRGWRRWPQRTRALPRPAPDGRLPGVDRSAVRDGQLGTRAGGAGGRDVHASASRARTRRRCRGRRCAPPIRTSSWSHRAASASSARWPRCRRWRRTPTGRALAAVRAGRVYVADGNLYFNRSGPLLFDTPEHPRRDPAPRGVSARARGHALAPLALIPRPRKLTQRPQLLERHRAHGRIGVAHLLQQGVALHARVAPALCRRGSLGARGRAAAHLARGRMRVVGQPEAIDPLGAGDADSGVRHRDRPPCAVASRHHRRWRGRGRAGGRSAARRTSAPGAAAHPPPVQAPRARRSTPRARPSLECAGTTPSP